MTYQPKPDRNENLRASAQLGWTAQNARGLESFFEKDVSGGGLVQTNDFGVKMDPGTTSGDKAQLEAVDYFGIGNALDELIFTVCYMPLDSTPFTDDAELGPRHYNLSNDTGAYLDLTNGNYQVGGTTTAATLPSANSFTVMEIRADYDAGETVFTQTGSVNETATISSTPSLRDGVCLMESNGNGDSIRLYDIQLTPIFDL